MHNDGTEEDIVTINPQDFQFGSQPDPTPGETKALNDELDADLDYGFDLDHNYKRMCSDLRQVIVKFSQIEQILADLVLQNKSKQPIPNSTAGMMEFNRDFGELSHQVFAERSNILHFRHAEKVAQINTASVKLHESLLKELLLQLDYVRDIIARCTNVRKLCVTRDEAY